MTHFSSKSQNRISWKRHLVIWALVTIYISILDPIKGDLEVQIPVTFILMYTNVLAFYSVSLYIFPKFWKKNYFLLILFATTSFLIFTILDFLDFRYLLPPLGGKNYYAGYSVIKIIWRSIYSFSLVSIPALAYFFTNLSLEKIETQNEREKSLLLRELNFLKNPRSS